MTDVSKSTAPHFANLCTFHASSGHQNSSSATARYGRIYSGMVVTFTVVMLQCTGGR
jgi:hypothetical protein